MLVALAVLIASACSKSGVEIYAPAEFAEGAVILDGAAVAKLSKPLHNYRWRGWRNAKDELSAPPRHESAAMISDLSVGMHEISLTKDGYVSLRARFDYKRGKRVTVDLSGANVQQVSTKASKSME